MRKQLSEEGAGPEAGAVDELMARWSDGSSGCLQLDTTPDAGTLNGEDDMKKQCRSMQLYARS